ncbi:MAG: 3-methyl-2-oxobutanoate hydroxymethyltransferase [Thaumarchaeota archaeon]|nr:3-methyl-2-oxobutanoate hydroxymethyltransferase [Nitrososphaerota archaeon]
MGASAAAVSALKGRRRISCLTAYDATMASLVDRAGIDVILVGDSAGMVVMGQDDTLGVGMAEMSLFVSAVAAARPGALVVADMPAGSYAGAAAAASNAARLAALGAPAVKVEGGAEVAGQVRAIAARGIGVMGHIGYQPQSGGPRRRGLTRADADSLVASAQALEGAGAFAVVLEMLSSEAAGAVTRAVGIPTIGIGSGPSCDGQVLVLHDMLGVYERLRPAFARRYRDLASEITSAAAEYRADVESGAFPSSAHSFSMGAA